MRLFEEDIGLGVFRPQHLLRESLAQAPRLHQADVFSTRRGELRLLRLDLCGRLLIDRLEQALDGVEPVGRRSVAAAGEAAGGGEPDVVSLEVDAPDEVVGQGRLGQEALAPLAVDVRDLDARLRNRPFEAPVVDPPLLLEVEDAHPLVRGMPPLESARLQEVDEV
ncbi:MAG: hypothetical protein ACYTGV_15545 [Planctomycetota bacterium]